MNVADAFEEGRMLARLIDAKFETRQEFADLLGVSKFKVSHWVNGRTRLAGNDRKKVAALLGIGETSLRPAFIAQNSAQDALGIGIRVPIARDGHRMVPVYGSVPAGAPGKSFSDAIEFVEMPDWGDHFTRWGRTISGGSMEPEFLHRDIVVFEDRRAQNFDVVYATKDGEEAIKVLIPDGTGKGLLAPINPDYEAFSADGWEILGVCIYRERTVEHGDVETKRYRNGATWRPKA